MQIQDLMSSMLDRYSQIKHSNNEQNKNIFESLVGVSADCQTETELNSG